MATRNAVKAIVIAGAARNPSKFRAPLRPPQDAGKKPLSAGILLLGLDRTKALGHHVGLPQILVKFFSRAT